MIGEFIYMLPSDMNLRIGKVRNYNNKILISSPNFKIGTNLKINLDEEKDKPNVKPKGEEKIKSEPNIKFNKEHKQDVKIIRTKPNIKKEEMMENEPNTHDEEKTAFYVGHDIYLYGMVAVQMIYFLLAFVIKYVYIKTPTPVTSAHKF